MCKTEDGKIKISIKDMVTSGSTGQTSATGAVGVLYELVTLLIVLALVIFYFVNQEQAPNIMAMIDKMTIIMGIGAALLGTRKISGAIANANKEDVIKAVERSMDDRRYRDPYYDDPYRNRQRQMGPNMPMGPGGIYRSDSAVDPNEEIADETIPEGEQ